MPLIISSLDFKLYYNRPAITIIFSLSREEDKVILKTMVLAYLKDIHLDLYNYALEVWKDKLSTVEFLQYYMLTIAVRDQEKYLYDFTVKLAFEKDVFAQARKLKNIGQDEVCNMLNIGRTTLFKLETDYNYREAIRKDSYQLICSILKKELKELNYVE
jgi:DNA-binding XRE family transcriptional regulator